MHFWLFNYLYFPLTNVSVFLLQTIHNNHELKQILCLQHTPGSLSHCCQLAELAGGKLGFGRLLETLVGHGMSYNLNIVTHQTVFFGTFEFNDIWFSVNVVKKGMKAKKGTWEPNQCQLLLTNLEYA